MAAAEARARLGRLAAEAVGGPGIDHLHLAAGERLLDVAEIGDGAMVAARGEVAGLAVARRAALNGTALGNPLRQATVEDEDAFGAGG